MRFVVLEHRLATSRHWDLMIQQPYGDLRTWALRDAPSRLVPITALGLPDHRMVYLRYQGPISKRRGDVVRWDSGVYSLLADNSEQLTLSMRGTRLQGIVELKRTKADRRAWTFLWQ